MTADTSVSLVRCQQGEQAVAGVGMSFLILFGSVQAPYLTDITDSRWMGTNDDVISRFNHPLQSLPVWGRTHHMSICDVSSQDVLNCSSVKVNKILGWEFCLLKFP